MINLLSVEPVPNGTKVYSGEGMAYNHFPNLQAVAHSLGMYDSRDVSTTSLESHWALMKRGIYGTNYHINPKHTHRYVADFADRHNSRPSDTLDLIKMLVKGMGTKRLR